jgi:hypothetical protein
VVLNREREDDVKRADEEMTLRGGMPLGYVSMKQFAKIVGVTPPRILQLIKRGRIEGVRRHNDSYIMPEDARILPVKNKTPGPVTDYVKSWHERNKGPYPEQA